MKCDKYQLGDETVERMKGTQDSLMEGTEFSHRHHSNAASKVVGIGQGRVMMRVPGSSAESAYSATQQ